MAQGSIGKKFRPPRSGLSPRQLKWFYNHGMYLRRRLARMSATPCDRVQPSRCAAAAMALQQGSVVRVVATGAAATQFITRFVVTHTD
jgi:hypothetical protein